MSTISHRLLSARTRLSPRPVRCPLPLPRLGSTNASPFYPAPSPASRLPRRTTRPNPRRCVTSGRRRQATVGMRTSTAAAAATSPGPTRLGSAAPGGLQGQGAIWRTWCATRCVVCYGADRLRSGGWADDVWAVRREGPLRQPLPPPCAQTVQAVRIGGLMPEFRLYTASVAALLVFYRVCLHNRCTV